ncbi:GDSL Lipase/Acylhydrolase family protein [Cordyceps fumosorosea ARSEF 2679]|uniref:GDSL Lipase/Acylhydrolase family protein n=1 Tax=Cordyceps fumosorosea (strain ARSEF 2679) TaxID=1081104 RepID=A0A168EFH6_CORFA|nr:GDSL Lipase/Acylhydrolase family protein [Cordyceps fumosorosea ARSEF 2679]OAA73748.1 GDSL Lipase/Acylhydrolase family protein [Cordyceps fumosorosea ARSEF 2679]
MALIKNHTTIPIPQVYDFEASTNHHFGYPYTLMERLPGNHVSNGVAESIPGEHHAKIARQLANVFSELQNLTFTRIGRIMCGDKADGPVEVIPMAWHCSPGPLETSDKQLSVCPEVVAFPGLSEEQNRPIVELKNLVLEILREMEKTQRKRRPLDSPGLEMEETKQLTLLSTYMASKSAIITHRQYMATPPGSLFACKRTAKLLYGETVTWEQLRQIYGNAACLDGQYSWLEDWD